MLRRYISLTCGLLIVGLCVPSMVDACPSCNLIDDPIARGFNWGVIFLMAMPFAVFGTIGGSVFYMYNRTNKVDNEPRSDAKGV